VVEVVRPADHNRESGHIEVGFTLAAMILIGSILYVSYATETYSLSGMFELWLIQPLWIQLLTIVVPVVILVAGFIFERASQWPKYDDPE